VWSSFVMKLGPDGDPIWLRDYRHWSVDYAYYPSPNREVSVAVDAAGSVVVAGHFDGQTYFDDQLQAPYGGADAYVVKLSPGGDFVWSRLIHGPAGVDGDQWTTSLAIDPCSQDVYVSGGFNVGIEVDGLPGADVAVGAPEEEDMFLLKLAGADGKPQWLRTFGDAGWQRANRVRVDGAGNVVMTGVVQDQPGYQGVDFGPAIGVLGPAVPRDPDAGGADYNNDLFIVKFDTLGNGLWGIRLGNEDDQTAWDAPIDSKGNIALLGDFNGQIKFTGLPPYSSSYYDGFIAWLHP
jgi:hypothetical protein